VTEIGRSSDGTRIPIPGDDRGAVTIAWAAHTDVGLRRAANEDSYIVQPPVFAVADGMGGHSAGDLASTAVVTRLAETLAGFTTPAQVGLALAQAAHDITRIAGTMVLGAGTTATGAALTLVEDAPYFAIFNVGDSRVYSHVDGVTEQVTIDHSVVQELVDAGAITKAQAEHHPDSNVITRAIGFGEPPMPDYWLLPLVPGLRLLACSDGLTKEVGEQRIAALLDSGDSAAVTAKALVDEALAAGGRDNVTVVLVDVLEVPPQG
jgi:PPM family protein phosphatase